MKEMETEIYPKHTHEEMAAKMNKIHNVDCLEFMKRVPDDYFDLVLTDPPYGIGASSMVLGIGKSDKSSKSYNRKWANKKWDDDAPVDDVFDEIFRISKHQIIWGGNYFNLPPFKNYILWDKEIPDGLSFADCELAWTSYNKAPSMFRYSAYKNKNEKVHPTQKPPQLFSHCIDKAGDIKTVFDPFMGSGTTAIACKSLGLEWCGCELELDYVKIANKRLSKVQTSIFSLDGV